jgi:RND family efflux transporter MFP subunit
MKLLNLLKLTAVLPLIISCGKSMEEKSLNQLASEVIPVKVVSIQNANTKKTIEATGLINTENEANYAFKIGGVIDKILVNEGEAFKKGQLLATLKISEIEAQYLQAEMNYEKAKRDYTRTNNLFKDSVATLEQLQNAKTNLDFSLKTLDAVAFNKKYARIYANADGFVTKKNANVGEIITAGSPVLAINELNANKNWLLKISVTDKDWTSITLNQKAEIKVDAFTDKTFHGFVSKKALASDQSNGSFQIEIKIIDANEKFAVGMFAKTKIEIPITTEYPTIPFEALIEADGNKAMVFVPINDKVKRIPITIESFNDQYVVVKSGLENYKSIVTSNSAFLNENSSIKIIK